MTADAKSREYGAANPSLTAIFTGFENGETFGSPVVAGSPDLATSATPTSTVLGGPYPITITVGSLAAANYDFAFVPGCSP